MSDFNIITKFEEEMSIFFGSKYAIAVDSCTHGIELCLRHFNVKNISIPKNTYISVPFLSNKLNIALEWRDEIWEDYYYITPTIIDAAVLWKKNSYVPGTFMSLSFQYQKHLSLGRGGMILTDNIDAVNWFKKARYEGRSEKYYKEDNISSIGWNMYMTPQDAAQGLCLMQNYPQHKADQDELNGYRDLTEFEIFKRNKIILPNNE
jgi:dTDP-4-amino-4,6-dideoxygalactose transaminase